jgi:hypothetical protein
MNYLKSFSPGEKVVVFLNSLGFSSNMIAWVDDNKLFASNLLLFGIPTALYTFYRFRQKFRHQEELNRLEIARLKKEADLAENDE